MKKVLAEWHAQPDLAVARTLRQQLEPVLKEHGVATPADFLLATAELVVNLCRYPEPKPKMLTLRLLQDERDWSLELLDDGGSFRNFSQHLNNKVPLTASESGMGLRLLAAKFDDIAYIPGCYRADTLNMMVLRRRIEQTAERIKTVLLVDDDVVYRAVICAYLSESYRVIEAGSVQQAYAELLNHKPDLVICDISMPEQDGTELFDQLSHIPSVASTAFIYLSGCDDRNVVSRAVSRPIDDFLIKPTSKQQLLQSVSRVLQRRSYLAEQIQRELDQKITLGLYPSLPGRIGDYQCALRCQQPQAGGGDLVLLNQTQMIFADLMGHGVEAKGYAFALAGYLRGLCSALTGENRLASNLLERLSIGFNDDPVLSETLATIMAVDLRAGKHIVIANAGHPVPLIIRDDQVLRVDITGPLLGLGLTGYTERTLCLERGARLLLYSDGFWDAAEPFPPELESALRLSAAMSLEQAADYLMACRNRLSAGIDDCTLILLQNA